MAVTSALIKIGMPAIPALVDKILKTNNDRIKKKCVLCCAVIEGLHMTRMRFEDRIKNEVDQAKKQKFESALQILNNFKVLKDGSIFMDWF